MEASSEANQQDAQAHKVNVHTETHEGALAGSEVDDGRSRFASTCGERLSQSCTIFRTSQGFFQTRLLGLSCAPPTALVARVTQTCASLVSRACLQPMLELSCQCRPRTLSVLSSYLQRFQPLSNHRTQERWLESFVNSTVLSCTTIVS